MQRYSPHSTYTKIFVLFGRRILEGLRGGGGRRLRRAEEEEAAAAGAIVEGEEETAAAAAAVVVVVVEEATTKGQFASPFAALTGQTSQ